MTVTLDRFEGEIAVLRSDGGQEIHWPKNELPPDAHEGSVLDLRLDLENDIEAKRRATAKDILNEIFGSGEPGDVKK